MDVLFVFFEAGQVTKPSLFLPLSIQTTLRLASSSRTLAIGPFTRPGKVYSAVHFFPTAAQLSMCHIYPYTRYLKRKREGRGEREAILCEKQIRKKIANTWQPGIKLRFQAGFKANVFATFFFLDTKINFPYPFCYSFPLTLDFTFLLFNLFPANVPTQEHDFSHFLSYSSWKKRVVIQILWSKHIPLMSIRWRKPSALVFGIFSFHQVSKKTTKLFFSWWEKDKWLWTDMTIIQFWLSSSVERSHSGESWKRVLIRKKPTCVLWAY